MEPLLNTYDPSGNPGLLSNVTYSGGSEAYTYDTYGRLTSTSKTIEGSAYVTSYAYDAQSRMSALTYPSGFKVNYLYDDMGYLSQVKRDDTDANIWRADTRNAYGQYTDCQSGNGSDTYKTYTKFGVLKTIQTQVDQY